MSQTSTNTPEVEVAQPKPASNPLAIKNDNEKNKKTKLILINALVFILISLGFYVLIVKYFHVGDTNYTESAQVEEFINPINTRVAGYIKEIKFIEHQRVAKGDTLLIIDDSEIITQVMTARAAYQSALAAKEMTKASLNTNTNNIEVYSSNIAGAKAKLVNTEQNLHRYTNLVAQEAVTKAQYDQVEAEYKATKATYDVLIKQQNTVGLSVKEIATKLALNDADIAKAAAALQMAELNLSYTIIKAPANGIMGRRLISEGQLLNPSAQISTIVIGDQKWVTANFLESQLQKVAVGTKVNMNIDALDNVPVKGVVTAISGATGARYSAMPTDNSTGNFVKVQQRIPVRIEFTEDNSAEVLDQLRAGMNVVVKLAAN